ncbi:MAG: sulfatase-like hydrolase/transferase [Verrucomicrobia bacterium]|nr:sulfatase-like hydrolase/transferase [Verrucomicrobiota bacterium]MDA1068239.1 sulfatase-like hydrolase/transferase [Verrucomicrobiota bacterium]
MTRINTRILATVAILLGLFCTSNGQAEINKPNIIFVLVDDLGWGDLGVFYQNSRDQNRKHATPMLDKFAAEGMQLRQHYCPAPVCAPSRASLLSGRHQGHEPIRDNQFDKDLADSHTLGTVLKTAGYRTAMVGKYGLPGGDREKYDLDEWIAYPTERGFDEFFGYVKHRDGHAQYPAHAYERGDSDLHRTPKPVFHNRQKLLDELKGCYTTDLFTAFAKNWIVEHRENNPIQPFFLYLAHSTPHAALHTPSTAYPEGGGLKGGIQWIGKPGHMINTAGEPIDSWIHPDYADQMWTEVEKRFATMVRRIDSSIADLVQTLKDLNIDRETIVIFSSDNGPHEESYLEGLEYAPNSFGSYGPFQGIKRDVSEGGIRMPTLVRWPGQVPSGAINQTPSQFHDWLPTLANISGLPAPAISDGVSLLPFLTGQGTVQESTIYVEYFNSQDTPSYPEFSPHYRNRPRKQQQVVFIDGFKGIRVDIKSHEDQFEIYDLSKDPREIHNLANTNDYFESLGQRMKDRVLQIRRSNESAPRPYDDAMVPGIAVGNFDDQVKWSVYEGSFPWVPQTVDLKPSKTGTSTKVDLGVRTRDKDIAVEFTGYLKINESGEYTITVDSDSGAIFRLHDAVVVDNESVINGIRETSGKILLEKGVHPYTLRYSRKSGGKPALNFSYEKQ